MKGKVDDILTLNGDKLYDYGKLYQSILGYDCILNNCKLPDNYAILRTHFENEIIKNNIDISYLKVVTFSLVIGTLHSIENIEVKQRVWNWIKEEFL